MFPSLPQTNSATLSQNTDLNPNLTEGVDRKNTLMDKDNSSNPSNEAPKEMSAKEKDSLTQSLQNQEKLAKERLGLNEKHSPKSHKASSVYQMK